MAGARNEGMSLPARIFVLFIMICLGAAAANGAFEGLGKDSKTNSHGTFEVTVEWHAIYSGVKITVTRNGASIVGPNRIVRAQSPSKPQVFRFPGRERDKVHLHVGQVVISDHPDGTGFIFGSIIFKRDDGTMPLHIPKHARDTSPIDREGINVYWP